MIWFFFYASEKETAQFQPNAKTDPDKIFDEVTLEKIPDYIKRFDHVT